MFICYGHSLSEINKIIIIIISLFRCIGLLYSRIIVFLRDDCLVFFSNNVNFSHDELDTFIFYICTN